MPNLAAYRSAVERVAAAGLESSHGEIDAGTNGPENSDLMSDVISP